ncbi:hypothetical protein Leryth_013079 [Lithospermum erythrorhizon]|nr:hypothetical protein Leryth_013079 [Lithospermum erythrorhizon]
MYSRIQLMNTWRITIERGTSCRGFFVQLERRVGELGISNFQIGLTTLEEVFLTVAETAEKEEADE